MAASRGNRKTTGDAASGGAATPGAGGQEPAATSPRPPLSPIVKWVGGKRQLLGEILPRLPEEPSLYVEPFMGGAAVLLAYRPARALANDGNPELVNVYEVVRDSPDALIDALRAHAGLNSPEHYYEVRALDRSPSFDGLGPVERAARFVYINKTCFNGLWRVNSKGQVNSPYGRYRNPDIVNEDGVRELSAYLNEPGIRVTCGDYAEAFRDLPQGAFVYLDPPYMPVTKTSAFTGYTSGGFPYAEQERLKGECDRLREQGIRFLQSNSDCDAIRELYRDYEIDVVTARRAINSKGDRRGAVNEVLIHW